MKTEILIKLANNGRWILAFRYKPGSLLPKYEHVKAAEIFVEKRNQLERRNNE